MPQKTRNKILEAAIDLMSVKGYTATTTREIAQVAGLAEMTLFRKFNTKKEILEKLIEKYTVSFKDNLLYSREDLAYDLEVDLVNFSRTYHRVVNENKKVLLLAFKESGIHDEISEQISANPRLMKQYLIDYLTEMRDMGKIADLDLEFTAMSFILMNLGYYSSQFISVENVAEVSIETFIKHSVKVFVRGLSEKTLEKITHNYSFEI